MVVGTLIAHLSKYCILSILNIAYMSALPSPPAMSAPAPHILFCSLLGIVVLVTDTSHTRT